MWFPEAQGHRFPEEEEGKQGDTVEREGKVGGWEPGQPSTSPRQLGLAEGRWGGGRLCQLASVGQSLMVPRGFSPAALLGPLLPAHFLQHQQQISIFAQSPGAAHSTHPSEPGCQMPPLSPSRDTVCEGRQPHFPHPS